MTKLTKTETKSLKQLEIKKPDTKKRKIKYATLSDLITDYKNKEVNY